MLALLEKEISNRAWFGLAFLVDGFPRNIAQADAFEERIRPADAVIYFDCPDQVLQQRLAGRGASSGRSDDNPSTARSRLKTFHSQTEPVVRHFEAQGKLHRWPSFPIECPLYDMPWACIAQLLNSTDACNMPAFQMFTCMCTQNVLGGRRNSRRQHPSVERPLLQDQCGAAARRGVPGGGEAPGQPV